MVCSGHVVRRGPSPQGAGSVYWLDRGATAPTVAPGGQQFAFVCSARVPLSQPGQSVHEADVGAFEFGLESTWGHPVALAESFVDPQQYRGTAYKVSGWSQLGLTRGWKRRRVLREPLPAGNDRGILLAAFITKMTKAQFEARHVFFQQEDADTYIGKILTKITASVIAALVSP